MTDLTNILGIALIGVGAASAVYGTILCYSVKVLRNCVHLKMSCFSYICVTKFTYSIR